MALPTIKPRTERWFSRPSATTGDVWKQECHPPKRRNSRASKGGESLPGAFPHTSCPETSVGEHKNTFTILTRVDSSPLYSGSEPLHFPATPWPFVPSFELEKHLNHFGCPLLTEKFQAGSGRRVLL
ncbi:hypothetical protein AVEN_53947-1 [Araneus ventricosus]|uniref:Uncharacterized protein n=1 Tax=Araneus ventricosus TaxID=182803 RepID=A0A4Y2JH67_ARAVE|nr:hypothetical protein AVEN_53947-1 [Araneus ventricosus]